MDERTAHKSVGVLAVVAGLIAASEAGTSRIHRENKSPRVRSIISDSITIARMVVEASKAKL
jgi:archaeosine-15-forming tRNA-guanine transglycosylase